MKLCEMCRKGEESWQVVRQKIADSNAIKNLVLLLLRKDEELNSASSVEEAAFSNKAIVLDVLYALSNLDSFENEVESGEMGERIIKAGGCVVSCALINRCAAEAQQNRSPSTDDESNIAEGGEKPHQLMKKDLRTKTRIEVIRSAISLLSSMAFVAGTTPPVRVACNQANSPEFQLHSATKNSGGCTVRLSAQF